MGGDGGGAVLRCETTAEVKNEAPTSRLVPAALAPTPKIRAWRRFIVCRCALVVAAPCREGALQAVSIAPTSADSCVCLIMRQLKRFANWSAMC